MARVHGLNRLHDQREEVVEGAVSFRSRKAKAAGVLMMAVGAHLTPETTDIAFEAAAIRSVDRLQVRRQ
jgi:hypothetical protein